MKPWSRSLGDPFFHLTALVILGVLAVAVRGASPRASSAPDNHPAHCHACSTVPPGAAARTDAALVRVGCIDGPATGD